MARDASALAAKAYKSLDDGGSPFGSSDEMGGEALMEKMAECFSKKDYAGAYSALCEAIDAHQGE